MQDTVINDQDHANGDLHKVKTAVRHNIANGLYLPFREVKKRHFCFFAGAC